MSANRNATPKKSEIPVNCPACKSSHFTATFAGASYLLLTCAICDDGLLFNINLGGRAENLLVMPTKGVTA